MATAKSDGRTWNPASAFLSKPKRTSCGPHIQGMVRCLTFEEMRSDPKSGQNSLSAHSAFSIPLTVSSSGISETNRQLTRLFDTSGLALSDDLPFPCPAKPETRINPITRHNVSFWITQVYNPRNRVEMNLQGGLAPRFASTWRYFPLGPAVRHPNWQAFS